MPGVNPCSLIPLAFQRLLSLPLQARIDNVVHAVTYKYQSRLLEGGIKASHAVSQHVTIVKSTSQVYI